MDIRKDLRKDLRSDTFAKTIVTHIRLTKSSIVGMRVSVRAPRHWSSRGCGMDVLAKVFADVFASVFAKIH